MRVVVLLCSDLPQLYVDCCRRCYNGHGREVKKAQQDVCECTKEDYQWYVLSSVC